MLVYFSCKRFSFLVFSLLIATNLSILFDISMFRQVLGFVFYTVVPGLLILSILRINKLDFAEKIILSIGLSLSFMMFYGLLVNWIMPLFWSVPPLSTDSLLVSFSIIIFILILLNYLRGQDEFFTRVSRFRFNKKITLLLLLPFIFPILSILGMYIMNTTGNNVLLIAFFLSVAGYIIFIATNHDKIPNSVYPLLIFMVSISIILLLGLRSTHLIGSDVHSEFFIFKQTFINGEWKIVTRDILDSCLSISILPCIYQSFVNINPEDLFKILYPLLFSISPVVIYAISKKYVIPFYAFLASLFFMSQTVFLWAAYNPRTDIALLFVALSIMVLFNVNLHIIHKRALFIIFSISCVVSHYSAAFIFFFIILFAWGVESTFFKIYQFILNSLFLRNPSNNNHHFTDKKYDALTSYGSKTTCLSLELVAGYFIFLYLWYNLITAKVFYSGVNFFANSLESLKKFLSGEVTNTFTTSALGFGLSEKGIGSSIFFIFSWLTIVFIAIGVLASVFKCGFSIHFKEKDSYSKPIKQIDRTFLLLAFICSAFLGIALLIPFISTAYGTDRLYCEMMIFLSVFFIIGGSTITKLLRRHRAHLLILCVLIPYLLCNAGIVSQISGVPQTIILNSVGQSYDLMYVHDQESNAAIWFNENSQNVSIYSDFFGTSRLISQGGINPLYVFYAKSLIEDHVLVMDAYFYIRYTGVINQKLSDWNGNWHDLSEYSSLLNMKNLLYNNGGSHIIR